MVYIVSLAKEAMGETELAAVKKFEDDRNKRIGDMSEEEMEDIWWFLKVRSYKLSRIWRKSGWKTSGGS
jgi:hypothetical protein